MSNYLAVFFHSNCIFCEMLHIIDIKLAVKWLNRTRISTPFPFACSSFRRNKHIHTIHNGKLSQFWKLCSFSAAIYPVYHSFICLFLETLTIQNLFIMQNITESGENAVFICNFRHSRPSLWFETVPPIDVWCKHENKLQ